MKKLRKLRLLNASEMKPILGGASCNKTGDTILCAPLIANVKVCASFEATCPGSFSSSCSIMSSITITCPSSFTVQKG